MKSKKAFTLIELLVVISILALLLSIMLPSLNKARDAARTVVCKAHLRSFGLAFIAYETSHNGRMPGPNTSGLQLTRTNSAPESSSPDTPVQNMDWISPLLGTQLGFSADRKQRLTEILGTDLKCPSVHDRYDYVYGGGWDESFVQSVYVSSYSASLAFHVKHHRSVTNPDNSFITDQRMSFLATVPAGYVPRFSAIGRPADKIFVMDGTRYVNQTGNQYNVSFNGFAKQVQGGNFMTYGPTTTFGGDPFKFRNFNAPELVEGTQRYAYRHGNRINVLFFDGRTETLTARESLKMSYYWPRGSRVNMAAGTWDPDDRNGDIIR